MNQDQIAAMLTVSENIQEQIEIAGELWEMSDFEDHRSVWYRCRCISLIKVSRWRRWYEQLPRQTMADIKSQRMKGHLSFLKDNAHTCPKTQKGIKSQNNKLSEVGRWKQYPNWQEIKIIPTTFQVLLK